MKDYPSVLSPTEIRFERLLPGPIETVWTYLTDEKKRGEWLASGPMDPRVGGKVELRFKHADLSPNQAPPPEKYTKMDAEGHHAEETITEIDPPRRLAFTWGGKSEVVFDLAPKDGKVLLTLTHRKLPTEDERDGNAARLALPPHHPGRQGLKADVRRPSGISSGRSARNTINGIPR